MERDAISATPFRLRSKCAPHAPKGIVEIAYGVTPEYQARDTLRKQHTLWFPSPSAAATFAVEEAIWMMCYLH
jgi:hypothetical protein